MPILAVDTIAVVVSDRTNALKWYSEILGLDIVYIGPSVSSVDSNIQGIIEKPGHWIELGSRRPTTRIHLCELEDHETEPGPTGITFLTDDIKSDYIRMTNKGVRFLAPPEEMEWGECCASLSILMEMSST